MTAVNYQKSRDDKLRAERYMPPKIMVVASKTIGAMLTFNLETENFSRTGLLINGARYKKVPFQVNTLLELTIDPKCVSLEKPVSCLGKVVRLEHGRNNVTRFGVHIILLEGCDLNVWERLTDTTTFEPALMTAS